MNDGILFLIPVPLGDMSDLSTIPEHVRQRVATLNHFVVERSKTARAFIKAAAPELSQSALSVVELNDQTPDSELQNLLAPLVADVDVGLLSEAGCPAVADPGSKLVALAHQKGIRVIPLVGPSSILLALMGSGMNGQSFAFVGYVAAKKGETEIDLKKLETTAKRLKQTQIFIETPYRAQQIIDAAIKTLNPDTKFCIAADLTLETEFLLTKPISEWKKIFESPYPPNFHKRPTIFLIG
ncbi:MAG: hypothetical protein RL757_293 [Bacteroidota bacterium]|jgi:16S rRNA (cytidine1402-2'-O)-methyltransferase